MSRQRERKREREEFGQETKEQLKQGKQAKQG